MRDPAASDDGRSVTIFMRDDVYAGLIEQARRLNRTPSARASELFHTAWAAQGGKSADAALDAVVRRLDTAAKATTTLKPPPIALPPEPVVLPAIKLLSRLDASPPPPARPEPVPEIEHHFDNPKKAAMTPRARQLHLAYGLTAVEASLLDVLLQDRGHTHDSIRSALPVPLQPSTIASMTVTIARMRKKAGLTYSDMAPASAGFIMQPRARERILSRLRVGEPV